MLPQLQASVQIHDKMYMYTHIRTSIFIIALKTFSNVVSLFSSPSTDIYSTSSSISETSIANSTTACNQELVIQSHSKTNSTTDHYCINSADHLFPSYQPLSNLRESTLCCSPLQSICAQITYMADLWKVTQSCS